MIGKKHGAVEREHYALFRPAVCNGVTARLGALFISRDYLASIHRARGKETQKFQGGTRGPDGSETRSTEPRPRDPLDFLIWASLMNPSYTLHITLCPDAR